MTNKLHPNNCTIKSKIRLNCFKSFYYRCAICNLLSIFIMKISKVNNAVWYRRILSSLSLNKVKKKRFMWTSLAAFKWSLFRQTFFSLWKMGYYSMKVMTVLNFTNVNVAWKSTHFFTKSALVLVWILLESCGNHRGTADKWLLTEKLSSYK